MPRNDSAARRRRLLEYVAPTVVLYSQVGSVGVYWMTDRDRRLALWLRHHDEHNCAGAIAYGPSHCEEDWRLWKQIDERDRPVAIA